VVFLTFKLNLTLTLKMKMRYTIKIFREELIESLKELLTHFELRTNELKDLKEKYVDLMKQQESTLLDLKASEERLRGFDFICKTYEEKLKFLC